MNQSPYRKEWLVGTSIARGFMGMSTGERIPTISGYSESFSCSRGIVQNALNFLEKEGAVVLDKQGKKGTFLLEKNDHLLIKYSGLTHLTASMPPPINSHFAGLATGICQGMSRSEVPFTFAFVHGAKARMDALARGSYDFIIATEHAAKNYVEKHPEVDIAFSLKESVYSLPYKLYINKPGKTAIEDGMTLAVDPYSYDQVTITGKVCEGKDVLIKEMPVISTIYAFFSGSVDAIVFRDSIDNRNQQLLNSVLKMDMIVSAKEVSEIELDIKENDEMSVPVVMVNRENYGIADILRNYLDGNLVGYIQSQVVGGQMAPRFY